MNREDIIRIALEASNNSKFTFVPELGDDLVCLYLHELERFVALVASAEREACANIADEYVGQDLEHNFSALIAHNIRVRE